MSKDKRVHVIVKNVERFDSQTGKQEEIDTMYALYEKFVNTQTYLSSFFKITLVQWFQRQVGNDLDCDIMSALDSAIEQRNQLEMALSKVHAEYEDKRKADGRDYEKALAEKGQWIEIANEHVKKIQALEAAFHELRNENDRLKREVVNHDENETRVIAELEGEITRLKARLYDLLDSK